jgi:hypothetical protein
MYDKSTLPFTVMRPRRNILCAEREDPDRVDEPRVGMVFVPVVFVRGNGSVGPPDVSYHRREVRAGKSTLIAEPTVHTIDGQRPPILDQAAKERHFPAAQERVAHGSLGPRILWRFHVHTKLRSRCWNCGQPPV